MYWSLISAVFWILQFLLIWKETCIGKEVQSAVIIGGLILYNRKCTGFEGRNGGDGKRDEKTPSEWNMISHHSDISNTDSTNSKRCQVDWKVKKLWAPPTGLNKQKRALPSIIHIQKIVATGYCKKPRW